MITAIFFWPPPPCPHLELICITKFMWPPLLPLIFHDPLPSDGDIISGSPPAIKKFLHWFNFQLIWASSSLFKPGWCSPGETEVDSIKWFLQNCQSPIPNRVVHMEPEQMKSIRSRKSHIHLLRSLSVPTTFIKKFTIFWGLMKSNWCQVLYRGRTITTEMHLALSNVMWRTFLWLCAPKMYATLLKHVDKEQRWLFGADCWGKTSTGCPGTSRTIISGPNCEVFCQAVGRYYRHPATQHFLLWCHINKI